jgi:hypothetical protein
MELEGGAEQRWLGMHNFRSHNNKDQRYKYPKLETSALENTGFHHGNEQRGRIYLPITQPIAEIWNSRRR